MPWYMYVPFQSWVGSQSLLSSPDRPLICRVLPALLPSLLTLVASSGLMHLRSSWHVPKIKLYFIWAMSRDYGTFRLPKFYYFARLNHTLWSLVFAVNTFTRFGIYEKIWPFSCDVSVWKRTYILFQDRKIRITQIFQGRERGSDNLKEASFKTVIFTNDRNRYVSQYTDQP